MSKVISRFGLDPGRPNDVVAASAYVWSSYNLPWNTAAPFYGPELDAACQAVMRYVLVNPNAFLSIRQSPQSLSAIVQAANGGLSDYTYRRAARPRGVDPSLQTNSARARAAIASELQTGRMQAHHLVPAGVWGRYSEMTKLAYQGGWRVDHPSNLIGLPADINTQRLIGMPLPIHNGSHPKYDIDTQLEVLKDRIRHGDQLTPLEARSIFEYVATLNRNKIIAGIYNPYIKVSM